MNLYLLQFILLFQCIIIRWRNDGNHFVVSYVCPIQGRTMKVFNKEGQLLYIGEYQPGLMPPIACKPSGKWIAMSQFLGKMSRIALFEKNGLLHRYFPLPFNLDREPIIDIRWCSISDILFLQTTHNLYLYTISNYHWYLKQVLEFGMDNRIQLAFWDSRQDEERSLHVLLRDGQYFEYKWYWMIDRRIHMGLNAIVMVIDGKNLLLTDFGRSTIPPPMYEQKLTIDNYINSVTMIAFGEEVRIYIYDSKHLIHCFRCPSVVVDKGRFYDDLGNYCCYYPENNLLPGYLSAIQAINYNGLRYLCMNYLQTNDISQKTNYKLAFIQMLSLIHI